jgi:urease subunit alpha
MGGTWTVERSRYATLYGPTEGDRVRLADTDLLVQVTEDRCRGPHGGDEAVFGGGKVIRESMGQARTSRADGAPDLVITGAIVLDHWGWSRLTLGCETAGSSAWARPGTRTSWTGCIPRWSSARAPR